MSKPGDKDWLPHDEYLRRIPKKRISAGVVFLNSRYEVLMVKRSYKQGWVIPGGAINQYESPLEGCVRETREEIGLAIPPPEFIGVVHVPRPQDGDDVVHFFFYGGILDNNIRLTLQAEELETYRFIPVAEIGQYAVEQFAQRFNSLLKAIKDKRPIYFQEEKADEGSVG